MITQPGAGDTGAVGSGGGVPGGHCLNRNGVLVCVAPTDQPHGQFAGSYGSLGSAFAVPVENVRAVVAAIDTKSLIWLGIS